jgi:mevalonate kinase
VLQALTLSGQVESGGVELVIESEFEHTLGLGSSAAVTVACMGAMALLANGRFDAQEAMQTSIESIRKVQGRGSGADVAASALGGIVKFQGNPLRAKKTLLSLAALQNAPHLLLVYCGYKTLTPLVIAQVAEAAEQEPQRFAQLYEQMGACVETSEKALERENWRAFAQSMNQYQILMRALGVSDESTETIIRLAQKKSPLDTLLGAKISGSGLGDCVLLLGSETLDWPHPQISVQIEPQGLRQEMQLPKALQREKQL